MLEEEGLVDLNDPVTAYLPELAGTDWEAVTVADVLHQRSGLDISESRLNSTPDHPVTLLYAILGGDTSLPPGTSLLEAVKLAETYMEPGEKFEYSSINTHVLSMILESVMDKPLEYIITELIWSKAGMEGDAMLGLSASGEPMAFGIFASRLRDLARFGMLFTPSWTELSDEQIISADYLEKVREAATAEVYGEDYLSKRLMKDFGETDFGASYQWDAVFPDGDMYKSGRTGQCLYVSPETNTVVVWFSSAYQAEVWVHAYAREIVNTLFR
jgi:CubicO group peptidase (beta-lactamase class C family)